ncbi:MAG TPA: MobA/MobL family protein [Rickettsia endosymbiont of Omalisus fontisbellaquei]|nr:MobA/MobL family protein [Rickettsia endosymbiont of Omalisus fontisbellaquei]
MAIYHFNVSSVRRSKGQNAVATAAYISASKLVYRTIDKETGEEISITYDYSRKKGVIYSGIKAPKIADGVEWLIDRERLWNKAEEKEKRKNSRSADKVTSALPRELTEEQNIELVEHYIDEYLVPTGMVVDYNLHYDNRNNPHVHFQTTTRDLEKTLDGEVVFSDKKNRVWWRKEHLKEQRLYWANVVNHHLKLQGILYEVTHKSFKDLGIDLVPTTHRGVGNYIEGSELQKQYDQIVLENANMIRNDPELVFQRLSISKPVFTKEDIAIVLSDALMINIGAEQEVKLKDIEAVREFSKSLVIKQEVEKIKNKKDKNKIKSIGDIWNIQGLNEQYALEFMKLYEMLLHSDKIELINPQDLQGRTLYALKKRVDLERRFIGAVDALNVQENHHLRITEADISKLNIREEIEIAINETGFKLQEKFNEKIGNKLGIGINLFNKRAGEFSEEQKKAIVGICKGRDISILEGYPGSGKTFVLREVVRQYKKAGYQVIGTGPSSVSAQVLGKATGIEARNTSLLRRSILESQGKSFEVNLSSDYYTEEQYLKESIGCDKVLTFRKFNKDVLNSKTLLIIDEASMLELASMDYLVNEVLKSGSKLLVVGDNNQFAAVGITGAFNKIKRICSVNSLSNVQRHRNEDLEVQDSYRRATELMGRYNINAAISIYKRLGVFNILDNEAEAKDNLIADYMEQYIRQSVYLGKDDLASIRSVVVGTYTNESVDYFNREIREKLKLAGILQGKEYEFRSGSKRITITKGEQIVFESNKKEYRGFGGVLNGEVGTVLDFNEPNKAGGGIIKVLVHKADGSKRIVNIDTEEDMFPVKFKHGYAVTGYKLQGETIDYMYVSYESSVGYEAFNVLMSRHKIEVQMYASQEELESFVYKRIDSDVESIKKSYEIESYEMIEREEYDDNGNVVIVREQKKVPSWLVGLVIGVSRRVDNNFALDYQGQEILDDNLLVIKDYLESLNEVFRWHKKMHQWKEQQEQPVLLSDLCNRIKGSGIKIDNPRSIIIDGYALIFAERKINFELRKQERAEQRESSHSTVTSKKVSKEKTPEEKAAEKRAYIFSKMKDMKVKNFESLSKTDQNIILLHHLSSAAKEELLAIYDELEKAKDIMSRHAQVICNNYNGWVDKKLEAEYVDLEKILQDKKDAEKKQRIAVTVVKEVVEKALRSKESKFSKEGIIKLGEEYKSLQQILKKEKNTIQIEEKIVDVINIAIQKAMKNGKIDLSEKQIIELEEKYTSLQQILEEKQSVKEVEERAIIVIEKVIQKAIKNEESKFSSRELTELLRRYESLQRILEKEENAGLVQKRAIEIVKIAIQEAEKVGEINLSKEQITKLEKEYENLQRILEEKESATQVQKSAVEVVEIAIQKASQGEESELSKKQITMGERIIQLKLNYETILKHAGFAKYRYYLKNIEEGKTISSSTSWQKLMKAAKDVSNDKELKDIRILPKHIGKVEKFIFDNKQKVTVKQGILTHNRLELTSIKQEIMRLNEYNDKLLPSYLKRIYKTPSEDVLNKWEELKKQNDDQGISKLIAKVKWHPNILGELKGVGIGTLIPISKNRVAAVKRLDILTKQLIKYDINKGRLQEIEALGGSTKYEKSIKILEQEVKLLQNKQLNKYEERFLDKLKLIQATEGLNRESFMEYVITKDVQDLIYENSHTKNEEYKRLDDISSNDNIEISTNINSLANFISEKDRSIIEIQDYLNANNPDTVTVTKQNMEDLMRFGTRQDMDNAFNKYKAYGVEVMNEFVYKTCQSSIEGKITNDLQILNDKWSGALTKEKELITVKDFKEVNYTNDYDYLAAVGLDESVMRYISKDTELQKKIQNEVQRVMQRQTNNELDR